MSIVYYVMPRIARPKPAHPSPALSYFTMASFHPATASIGNSVGVILPKELLAKLGVGKGDVLHAIETEDGIRLTASDPDFAAQMAVARGLMKKWHNVLRELAK